MDKQRDKVKEPFDPEKTPRPAQFPDPNMRSEKDQSNKKPAEPQPKNEKSKLLNEDADINDETTI
ncbi:MAG TPA: hypothetical protein VD927_05245 [Chryseosolibacter sp.]|nr:hypothetical protein [Chryseosolibacter sp.]